MDSKSMQRDFVGYGKRLPKAAWPDSARVAINFVINYEEGSESNVLDGDSHSENYLHDLPGSKALEGERHLSVESLFEYGSRRGVWRLLDLFHEFELPVTFFVTGLALERNQELAAALKSSPHEIAGHGYRWINYREVKKELESEHILKTLELIKKRTGKTAKGWYTGRKSEHTRELVINAGLEYDSDSYSDDLPYWLDVSGKRHLVIPYTLITNDMRYTTTPGWSSGEDFFEVLKDTFDCLYREGAAYPKMMTVALHPRLSGYPGRAEIIRKFLTYLQSFEKVWICRREDIAAHWSIQHPEKL